MHVGRVAYSSPLTLPSRPFRTARFILFPRLDRVSTDSLVINEIRSGCPPPQPPFHSHVVTARTTYKNGGCPLSSSIQRHIFTRPDTIPPPISLEIICNTSTRTVSLQVRVFARDSRNEIYRLISKRFFSLNGRGNSFVTHRYSVSNREREKPIIYFSLLV